MIVTVAVPVLVVLNIALWVVWSTASGWLQARRPPEAFVPGPLGRIRGFERAGRSYRRVLRVHRWKDRLPEAGTVFGGLSKRHLPRAAEGGLERFAQECLRAERTHGWVIAAVPVTVIWNPVAGVIGNAVYALAANLPCLVVVRANRARVEHILSTRRSRSSGTG
jgi:glycosyl-4,4'-diaponeurosporenoate acyltransferase